jgi:SEC-C motif-containing protein
MTAPVRCPCGSGDTYADCCAPLHRGETAPPTAQALMRSRFSAFAVADADYLRSTWHRSTRPERVELDEELTWIRLDIVDVVAGGLFDGTGIVEFEAHYRSGGRRGVLRERSHFAREDGRWFYVSARR